MPARIRFQRYRGMRSFQTSPWDPYENLPRDYARIFQFEDFKRSERGVRRRAEGEVGAEVNPIFVTHRSQLNLLHKPGVRVTVVLQGVLQEVTISSMPLVIFALFQHEHKKSVLNFTVQRNTEYDGSVRSKVSLSS